VRTDRCVILISVDGLAGFYLDDPIADMPTLRGMVKRGARANGVVCSFPTVTWPNHTTMVTGVHPGRHGVIANAYLDRRSGEKVPLIPDPLFDKEEIVRVPTVYDAAHQAGLKTAAIIWPATRNARSLNWTVPDMFDNDAWDKFGTRHWLAELRKDGIPVDQYGAWVKQADGGAPRDWLYVSMATQLLRTHAPNLVLIHLVKTDHVQHRFGPCSPDAYWSVRYADDRIRDIIEAVDRSPRRDHTTILVCSDHGFFPIEYDIQPNVLLKRRGLITVTEGKVSSRRSWAVSEGGACSVYILDGMMHERIASELRTAFAEVEGIETVLGPEQFGKVGQPTPDRDPRAPDLWLAAKSGYNFTENSNGHEVVVRRSSRGGTHGYLPSHPDMLGIFVAAGAGIRSGIRLDTIDILDVAPTIAHLLGIPLPDAEGKPLRSALLE
jgi:predicted AlkP superfamily pyrophosphatase or phosphodiesterase